jgi:hypothetical protein
MPNLPILTYPVFSPFAAQTVEIVDFWGDFFTAESTNKISLFVLSVFFAVKSFWFPLGPSAPPRLCGIPSPDPSICNFPQSNQIRLNPTKSNLLAQKFQESD